MERSCTKTRLLCSWDLDTIIGKSLTCYFVLLFQPRCVSVTKSHFFYYHHPLNTAAHITMKQDLMLLIDPAEKAKSYLGKQ